MARCHPSAPRHSHDERSVFLERCLRQFAAQGLQGFFVAAQGLQGFFAAAQGLQGFFAAAQGLQGFSAAAAQGLQGFFSVVQGLQPAICTRSFGSALGRLDASAAAAAPIIALSRAGAMEPCISDVLNQLFFISWPPSKFSAGSTLPLPWKESGPRPPSFVSLFA
jgi:hypothetical protein